MRAFPAAKNRRPAWRRALSRRAGRKRAGMDINQLIADNGACFYPIAFIWTFLEGEPVILFAGFAAAQGLIDPLLLLIAADRKRTRLNSSHRTQSRMPSS